MANTNCRTDETLIATLLSQVEMLVLSNVWMYSLTCKLFKAAISIVLRDFYNQVQDRFA